jgi:hypothetical protein
MIEEQQTRKDLDEMKHQMSKVGNWKEVERINKVIHFKFEVID